MRRTICVGMWLCEAPGGADKVEFPKEYFDELYVLSMKYRGKVERIREMIRKFEKGIENARAEYDRQVKELQKKYLERMGIKVIC
ncbi:MAG: hypothetical protein DRP08_08230 [Candidatus Aenigmatarchaeota archaeon]|nr:MAG: hypothetical protein DRP08_08230 [Candidatus Aenigmarchaeota archaeon]